MKRYLRILALCLVLALALAACGNNVAETPKADGSGTQSQAQAPAEAPKSDVSQTQQAPATSESANTPPAEEQKPAEAPVEYLFDRPAEPLTGDLGALSGFSAVYKGAVDGVRGDWKYELTVLKDLYGPGEHLMYMSGELSPEGRDTCYRYWDMDEDLVAGFAQKLKDLGFLDMNAYHVEEKNEAEDADRIVFKASYESGEELYFEAAGDHMPEGFDVSWQKLAMDINEKMGYATKGVTSFVPNADLETAQLMSNAVNWANAAVDSDYDIYTAAYMDDWASLVKNPMHLTGYEAVETGLWPHAMQYDRVSDVIYFLGYNDMSDEYELYSYNKKDEPVMIISGVDDYCAADGMLFYRPSSEAVLYSYDTGTGASTLFMDKGVHSFYPVGGWLVYLDDASGGCVRALDLSGGEDVLLVDDGCSCPIIEGNTLYYLSFEKGCIASRDLATGEYKVYDDLVTDSSFYLAGEYIYFYDCKSQSNGHSYGGGVPTCVNRAYMSNVPDPEDHYGTAFTFHDDGDVYFCYVCDDEGYVEYFCRRYNYFDGDQAIWLDPQDPDSPRFW
ncbi:MAG: DUF5050 domain-containing protein [Firmicutes bacterium]|nr:DUF5050 domain-containing protein [Bacillota bacterium]